MVKQTKKFTYTNILKNEVPQYSEALNSMRFVRKKYSIFYIPYSVNSKNFHSPAYAIVETFLGF